MKKLLKSKKILAIALALAMVFSMTSAVFADSTLNCTVEFTYFSNPIWNPGPVSTPMGTTMSSKGYFTTAQAISTTINPLGNQTSLIDAVLEAADNLGKYAPTGVDLYPLYGLPGAYISSVGNLNPWNQYWVDYDAITGKWMAHSIGEGWSAYVANGAGPETEPTAYLSRIALQDGDKIRFDYAYYEYEWETSPPAITAE